MRQDFQDLEQRAHRIGAGEALDGVGYCLARFFTRLTDQLAGSPIPELQTLRRTLMSWRFEILTYFASRITNGRTEGFNNKAKLVKRRAYGYRSFRNYRLRLLNACA